MKTNLSMLKAYPIGSIYISTNSISPAFLFGGSWEELKDHAILMTDSSATLGAYSGSNTMSVEQMPKHNHDLGMFIYNGGNTAVGKARYGFGYSKVGGTLAVNDALNESATSEISYGNRATGGVSPSIHTTCQSRCGEEPLDIFKLAFFKIKEVE